MRLSFFSLLLTLFLTNCATKDKVILQQKNYSDLNNWDQDNHKEAFKAYLKSCAKLKSNAWEKFFKNSIFKQPSKTRTQKEILQNIKYVENCCQKAIKINSSHNYQKFFEDNFVPFQIFNKSKKYYA